MPSHRVSLTPTSAHTSCYQLHAVIKTHSRLFTLFWHELPRSIIASCAGPAKITLSCRLQIPHDREAVLVPEKAQLHADVHNDSLRVDSGMPYYLSGHVRVREERH